MSQGWSVRVASAADIAVWAQLRNALWPVDEVAEHEDEAREQLAAPGLHTVLAFADDGRACGFAEASLRRDYVNGTESSPVGFLEGWYVAPEWRGRGVGRALIAQVEQWTRAQGCSELASDALLENTGSHDAHTACGFEETERVVYFRKALREA
ncbi:aminoglycoside 6'-N-acetyltransferase [Lysobacter silvisoli]|uniref:aminoglycoside 6'-N-acetyltransferase n=1 Tax=Lysobacter silvisoli TaxID=2293254 RepID=UPI001E4B6048|nr:aminoglycoside 6'-N-acetyltransferase [Lysobacter silvisoli]